MALVEDSFCESEMYCVNNTHVCSCAVVSKNRNPAAVTPDAFFNLFCPPFFNAEAVAVVNPAARNNACASNRPLTLDPGLVNASLAPVSVSNRSSHLDFAYRVERRSIRNLADGVRLLPPRPRLHRPLPPIPRILAPTRDVYFSRTIRARRTKPPPLHRPRRRTPRQVWPNAPARRGRPHSASVLLAPPPQRRLLAPTVDVDQSQRDLFRHRIQRAKHRERGPRRARVEVIQRAAGSLARKCTKRRPRSRARTSSRPSTSRAPFVGHARRRRRPTTSPVDR